MVTLLLCHKLSAARHQLLTVAFGQRVGPSPTLQEQLTLASSQMTVVALGS